MPPKLESKRFGITKDGKEVTLFTLSIPKKINVSVMNYGATWTHLFIPDRNGKLEDVVLGFDSFDGYIQKDYLDNYCYLGSTIGRVAGRFKNDQFKIDGKTYGLPLNQGKIHLHGGMEGWDKKLWKAEPFETANSAGVSFYYKSEDVEENYPGTVEVWVTYTLDETGTLEIKYRAITDQKTIINPTNHAYFNLSGDFTNTIEDHDLFTDADHYLSLNEKILPTGEIEHVAGSPFDFRNLTKISGALKQKNEQLKLAFGIDHCFVLNQSEDCAVLYHSKSGRKLTLSTTEPGLQVYTGNYLNRYFVGKANIEYGKNSAICLETQHFPDSCSHGHFPSILLLPGEVFQSRTVFTFSVE